MADVRGQARLLAALGEELIRLDLGQGLKGVAGMGMPGLVVGADPGAAPVLVFVSASGGYFTWQDAGHTHPVGDVEGAAGKLAAYLLSRSGGAG